MLKIFTDTPVQDRRCKVFPKFPSFLSLFYSTDKTDFPLVPAVFSGLSEHINNSVSRQSNVFAVSARNRLIKNKY